MALTVCVSVTFLKEMQELEMLVQNKRIVIIKGKQLREVLGITEDWRMNKLS